MDNVETRLVLFHNLFLICLIIALFMLLIAVILFIRLHIPQVLGYFTGTQAKREINKMKMEGMQVHLKASLADKDELEIKRVKSSEIPVITVTQRLENGQEQVSVLEARDATVMLGQQPVSFFIEREIILIHTDEIVE